MKSCSVEESGLALMKNAGSLETGKLGSQMFEIKDAVKSSHDTMLMDLDV